jgi:16S rRNA G1207 methylase RsmC
MNPVLVDILNMVKGWHEEGKVEQQTVDVFQRWAEAEDKYQRVISNPPIFGSLGYIK